MTKPGKAAEGVPEPLRDAITIWGGNLRIPPESVLTNRQVTARMLYVRLQSEQAATADVKRADKS